MKTIYTIWNYDADDAVISSEDKERVYGYRRKPSN